MSLNLLEFGPYRLDAGEKTLWRDGKRVPLTPKAVETLIVLAESGGRLVEKDELLKTVWPDTFVEEGSLAFQVSLLRKTIGNSYIETVPRRGRSGRSRGGCRRRPQCGSVAMAPRPIARLSIRGGAAVPDDSAEPRGRSVGTRAHRCGDYPNQSIQSMYRAAHQRRSPV